MTPRTEEDRKKIALECLKVEKRGESVLEYLKTVHHYLTPRATWFRLQKEFLGRKDQTIRSGEPEEVKITPPRRSKKEIAMICVDAVKKGADAYEALKDAGYTVPESRIWDARKWAASNDPEAYRILESLRKPKGKKKKKAAEEKEDEQEDGKEDENMKEDEKEPEKSKGGVTVAGESITVAGEKKELRLEQGVDYMVKAGAENAPEAGIRKPLMHSGMEACAWRGRLGEFHYDKKRGYIDFEGELGDEISLTLEGWKEFLQELMTAAKLMGVDLGTVIQRRSD